MLIDIGFNCKTGHNARNDGSGFTGRVVGIKSDLAGETFLGGPVPSPAAGPRAP